MKILHKLIINSLARGILITIILCGCNPIKYIDMNSELEKKYSISYTDSTQAVFNSFEAKSYGATEIGTLLSTKKRGQILERNVELSGGDFYYIDYIHTTQINDPYMALSDIRTEKSNDMITTTYTYSMQDYYKNAYPVHIYRVIPELKENVLEDGFISCIEASVYCYKPVSICEFCYPRTLENFIDKGFTANMSTDVGVPYIYYYFDPIAIVASKGVEKISGDKYRFDMDYKKLEMLLKEKVDFNYIPEKFEYSKGRYVSKPSFFESKPYPSILKIVRDGIKSVNEGIDKCSIYKKDDVEDYLNYLLKVEELLIKHGAREFEIE